MIGWREKTVTAWTGEAAVKTRWRQQQLGGGAHYSSVRGTGGAQDTGSRFHQMPKEEPEDWTLPSS